MITFSVVPQLSAAWAVFIERALRNSHPRILIGDCSGGLASCQPVRGTEVMPLSNFAHGEKLDLFFQKLCMSEYVIASDDDVFWLDDRAWNWAMGHFATDPKLAVVSLRPRGCSWPPMAKRIKGLPMGSYCLIIRREIWMKEGLSFKIVEDPEFSRDGFFFDTADYANVQLLERGYGVLVAPENIRSSVVSFDGTSCWALRIQQHRGKLQPFVLKKPDLQVKAYLCVLVLQEMSALSHELATHADGSELIPQKSLETARRTMVEIMEEPVRRRAEQQVASWFQELRSARSHWPKNGGTL